jgi:hypothetical protein
MNRAYWVEIEKEESALTTVTIHRNNNDHRTYRKPTSSSLDRLDRVFGFGSPSRASGWRLNTVYTYQNSLYVSYTSYTF